MRDSALVPPHGGAWRRIPARFKLVAVDQSGHGGDPCRIALKLNPKSGATMPNIQRF